MTCMESPFREGRTPVDLILVCREGSLALALFQGKESKFDALFKGKTITQSCANRHFCYGLLFVLYRWKV